MSYKDDILSAAKAMNEVEPFPDFPEDVVFIKMPDGTYEVCSKRFIQEYKEGKWR